MLSIAKILMVFLIATFNVAFANNSISVEPYNGKFYYEDLEPGTIVSDQAYIESTYDSDIVLKIYGVDGAITNMGGVAFEHPEFDEQDNIGKWLVLPERFQKITLEPGVKTLIDFEIQIPDNALPGEYPGGIIVELIEVLVNADDVLDDNGGGMAVQVSQRLAKNVTLNVAGELFAKLDWDFLETDEVLEDGSKKLKLDFTNKGNTKLGVDIEVLLKDGNNVLETYVFEVPALIMQGEHTVDVLIDEEHLPFWGSLDLEAHVSYQRGGISDESEFEPVKEVKTITISFHPPVWIILVLVAVILLLVLFGIWKWLVYKRDKKYSLNYIVVNGDTIQTVAEKFKVKWKKIGKFNHIKAPYLLTVGGNLIIPGVPKDIYDAYNGGQLSQQSVSPQQQAPQQQVQQKPQASAQLNVEAVQQQPKLPPQV